MDRLSREFGPEQLDVDWYTSDHGLTLLTIYSLSQNVEPTVSIKEFLDLVREQTTNSEFSDYDFTDASYARMYIASKSLGKSSESILRRQTNIYELGKNLVDNYYIHDYSVIDLVRMGERFNLTDEQLVHDYFEIYKNTKGLKDDGDIIDSDITALMWIAYAKGQKPQKLAKIARRIKDYDPGASPRKIIFLIQQQTARGVELDSLGKEEWLALLRNTHFSWRNLSDWLHYRELKKEQRRRQGSRSSSGGSYSSSYDSDEDNFGEVGVIFGADGLGIGIGIGGGMSIDPSDGSLAVGGFDMW